MTKPTLPASPRSKRSRKITTQPGVGPNSLRMRTRKNIENSDVLVSAVISRYLLTHLHHLLQRAENTAGKEGRNSQAANFAQLRKVLCMDARSMKDASAVGLHDGQIDHTNDSSLGSKVA